MKIKVGYVYPMIIRSEFHIEYYGVDDHREDASHFTAVWSAEALSTRPNYFFEQERYIFG